MSGISELEQRITGALERLARSVDALAQPVVVDTSPDTPPDAPSVSVAAPDAAPAAPDDASAAEIARLTEALEAERAGNAQLTQRVRALRERQDATLATLEKRNEKLTLQVDTQGVEVQRLRKQVIHLREMVRVLREAAEANLTEPHLINKAMLAELEALRATRTTEVAQMDEILSALDPLIAKETSDARA